MINSYTESISHHVHSPRILATVVDSQYVGLLPECRMHRSAGDCECRTSKVDRKIIVSETRVSRSVGGLLTLGMGV